MLFRPGVPVTILVRLAILVRVCVLVLAACGMCELFVACVSCVVRKFLFPPPLPAAGE